MSLSDSVELREGNFLREFYELSTKPTTGKQTRHNCKHMAGKPGANLLWRRRRPPQPGNGSSRPSSSGRTPSTRRCSLLQSRICLTGPAKGTKCESSMVKYFFSRSESHQHVVADVSQLFLHLLPVLFGLTGRDVKSLVMEMMLMMSLTICCFLSDPSVFCSMLEITLHELRRAPTTFL